MAAPRFFVKAKMPQLIALRLPCFLLTVSILATLLMGTHGIRTKRSSGFFGSDDDDATIRTEYVDRNNQTILDMFNLTRAQLSRITEGNSAANKDAGASGRDSNFFDDIKEHRVNEIKNRLNKAFQGGTSEESLEHPLHEMAAYPICNSESNESSWQQDNNVTIRFSNSLFEPKNDNLNLDSAILRLYKVNPNGTDDPNVSSVDAERHKPKRCADPLLDSQIRVTVSIVQQLRRNKRERKKRIFNTIMMNVSQTGWVEIDIRRAIYIWENVERQQQQQQSQTTQQHHHHPQPAGGRQPILVGWLMIEVHDEEERPLKPGLFFKPPKCDQADLAIPWNYYGPHASMPSIAADEVPRSPRLDVKLIGYASFAPKHLLNKKLHDQLHLNLRRQLYHLTQNSAEIEAESTTTTFTPTADNLVEASASTEILHRHRKRHSHHSQAEQQQQHEMTATEQQQTSTAATTNNEQEQQHQQQHYHEHRQHKQHYRHHHHDRKQHHHAEHEQQHSQEQQQHSREQQQQHRHLQHASEDC